MGQEALFRTRQTSLTRKRLDNPISVPLQLINMEKTVSITTSQMLIL